MSEEKIVVAFDLDGTLTVRDAVKPFLFRCSGPVRYWSRLALKSPSLIILALRSDRDAVKALATRQMLTGKKEEELRVIAERLARFIARSWMRPDTLERLRWHQAMGHVVVLVSASYELYVQPLAEFLNIEHVLATRVGFVDGVCTGELVGGNCRGVGKLERLNSWFGEQRLAPSLAYAYGDSSGDRELLAVAAMAVNVKRITLDSWPLPVIKNPTEVDRQ